MTFKEFYDKNQYLFWIIGIILAVLSIYIGFKGYQLKEKQEISENIDLAKNLILEMELNKVNAENIISILPTTKNTTEVIPNFLEVLRAE